ncbi:hypothetical protein VTN77DRAFT_977 [Rasamsonia byssochlamydoides]|uniref:uncharacterized protein n=1 Tax=Rasamsonia byssochlamydoides TaxID=89139 RepID=UPI0037445FC5
MESLSLPTPSNQASSPRVSEATFLAVLWVSVGLSFVFLVARLGIRFRLSRRWRADDAFVLAAWLLSLGNTCIWTTVYKQTYIVLRVARGDITTIPANIGWIEKRYLRGQLAGYILAYSSLWSIKLSFLFFFRKLGEKYRLQQIIWWVVLVVVILSFGGCLGMLDYACEMSNLFESIENCQSPHSIWYERVSLRVSTIMDIVSDAAIILLSGNVLWRVRIDWPRKLALIGLSLLTTFIITIALIRMALGIQGSGVLDPTWLTAWNGVEICVAIIVACLASFRTLYTMSKRSRKTHLLQNSYSYTNNSSNRSRRRSEGRSTTDFPILLESRISNSISGNNGQEDHSFIIDQYTARGRGHMPSGNRDGDGDVDVDSGLGLTPPADSGFSDSERYYPGIYVRHEFETTSSVALPSSQSQSQSQRRPPPPPYYPVPPAPALAPGPTPASARYTMGRERTNMNTNMSDMPNVVGLNI